MSKGDQWMPLYVAEYLADTGHLTTVQHGAYLLLLMHYWRKRELPEDDKQLAAIAKLPLRIWLDCKETIQGFFCEGWKHKRVEQELSKRVAIASKRAAAGSKGGASKSEANATVLLKQNGTHKQKQEQEQERNAVADDERARSGNLTTPEAMQLAEKLLVIAGHDPAFWPPGWCGAPMRVQTWLNEGWPPDIIVSAVTAAAKRKHGAPAASVQFFEAAIAEEIARQAAPVPVVQIREAEKITVKHGTNQIQSGGSLTDSIRRELAELEAQGADPALPARPVLLLSQ